MIVVPSASATRLWTPSRKDSVTISPPLQKSYGVLGRCRVLLPVYNGVSSSRVRPGNDRGHIAHPPLRVAIRLRAKQQRLQIGELQLHRRLTQHGTRRGRRVRRPERPDLWCADLVLRWQTPHRTQSGDCAKKKRRCARQSCCAALTGADTTRAADQSVWYW